MTFTSGIPNTGQSLGSTRDAIQNNFTNYNNTISVNHVAPNGTGAGKHTFAEFIAQGSDPATAANEITQYGKTVSASTELFIRKDNNGAVYQFTGPVIPSVAGNGYSFLPGGLIIQWGSYSLVNGQPSAVQTFPIAFPTNVFSLVITSASNNPANAASYTVSGSSPFSQFTSYRNQTSGVAFFTYIAIGN